jgi:TM2 domain-containing membrane protein YozV
MSAQWHLSRGDGNKYGPYSDEQMKEMAGAGQVVPTDMVWKEGMAEWSPATTIPGLFPDRPPSPPPAPPPDSYRADSGPQRSPGHGGFIPPANSPNKVACGVLGILLGAFGVHKFMLGITNAGIIMVLVSVLGCIAFGIGPTVMSIIGLVEGIIYLTKSDEEFYEIYVVGKKPWF